MSTSTTQIANRDQWLRARLELLREEKELTRRGDELARRRRDLPWVRIDKEYRFETPEGIKTLRELFDGCSQLLVYHGSEKDASDPAASANDLFGAWYRAKRSGAAISTNGAP